MASLFLVDGFNFLHAVVLKGRDRSRWWSAENQDAVRDWLMAHPIPGARAWLVFDQRGSGPGSEPGARGASPSQDDLNAAAPGGQELGAGMGLGHGQELRYSLELHHAPDADAHILACCRELQGACEVVVVSADRSLVDRARRLGARALSPWEFARYGGSVARGGGGPPGR